MGRAKINTIFPPSLVSLLDPVMSGLANSSGNRIADAVPDLILKSDQRWRGHLLRWLRSLDTINDQIGDVDFSVRVIGIAFSISTEQRRTRSGNLEECLDHSHLAQIVHQ